MRRMVVAGGLSALVLGGGWAVAAAGTRGPPPSPGAAPPTATEAALSADAVAGRKPAPRLVRFRSCRAFAAHARARTMASVGAYGVGTDLMRTAAPVAEGDVAAGAAPALAAPREGVDFSGTNVQEAGVDEPDAVKTDGRTIFSVAGGRLQAVDITGAAPRALPGLDITGMQPSGLLLAGDRLLVLGTAAGPVTGPVPIEGDLARTTIAGPGAWNPSTVIVQLDVSDPAAPRVLARMKVDGSLVSARRTGTTVRVVLTTSTARIPLVAPAGPGRAELRAATRANRRAVARAGAAAWLPRLTLHDATTGTTRRRPAVTCTSVARPTEFAGTGMIDVLTLGLDGPLSLLDSDAVMSDGDLVYASPAALYVATSRWSEPVATNGPPPRGRTLIHKLDTSDPSRTTYRGSGAVRGYLLNQFSMSEHEGNLRTASTEEPAWWSPPEGAGSSESVVTVLGEREGRLVRLGQVDGLGRGERIYAVRFIGTRAYVVTFRQTDPLYALDLSDPARPALRGELKIPGFSSYLHPIDETTLIGVGQAADAQGRTQGTQVSLFDVSDISSPRRIAQRALDGDWSEAESDHHAFTWWAPTRTLVLPVQSYGRDGRPAFLGAVGLTVARDTGITPIGRVRHPGPADAWSPVRRSLVAGDALYTVSDTGVMASSLATLEPRGWTGFP